MDDRSLKITAEIATTASEVVDLRIAYDGLRAELSIVDEKLEQVQERITIKNAELNAHKRKLKEMQANDARLREEEEEEEVKIIESMQDKKEEDYDKLIKIKMLNVISARQEGDADVGELFYFDAQKAEIKASIVIHTVKVKLVQPQVVPGKIQQSKIQPKNATFRINKTMTFEMLKKHACGHWVSFI
jgi:predicted nuclease with TOPRIM domain